MLDVIAHLSVIAWTSIIGSIHLFISIPTALHVLLKKEDESAVIGWIGLILLSPFIGSGLYWIFGVNRIKRQGKIVRLNERSGGSPLHEAQPAPPPATWPHAWQNLVHMGQVIHPSNYVSGNSIAPLYNGDEAYPLMIAAIETAQESIFLSSYIFDYDHAGQKFVDALCAAHKRNVRVYVLLDGIKTAYSWRRTNHALRKCGITTSSFFPKSIFYATRILNLHNHRKILSIDGKTAFIGGMNIACGNLVAQHPRRPIQDIHFRVTGPVIDQINQVFSDDWRFATGQTALAPPWQGQSDGDVTCRILPNGPDENYQKLEWTLLGAINAAQARICIMTPYFIPSAVLLSALQAAAMRGVTVQIIVPRKNNIPLFNAAMQANYQRLHKFGIQLFLSPAPFDHSKIFLIDDGWSFIGSSNWDARSLALNFEINLECFSEETNRQLHTYFTARKLISVPAPSQPPRLYRQIINNFFRLFADYL